MASRCSTALVDPPVATTPAMAFSSAGRVMRSRGRTPRWSRSIASRPACSAAASLAGSVAGMLTLPIAAMPRNSHTIAIVLAVNCPPHAPAPGQALSSRSLSSTRLMRPAAWAPTASNTSWIVTSLAVPVARLDRTAVEDHARDVQPRQRHDRHRESSCRSRTAPRRRRAGGRNVTSSIESAITSRLTSEARMPSVPIVMPSETAIVLNSIGVPPAARTPSFTCSASRRRWKLQGPISIQVLAMPTSGLAQVLVGEGARLEHGARGGAAGAVGERGALVLVQVGHAGSPAATSGGAAAAARGSNVDAYDPRLRNIGANSARWARARPQRGSVAPTARSA